MSKHTSGPWRAEVHGNGCTVHGTDKFKAVATVYSPVDGALIAAAPEMFEKLKEWRDSCGNCYPGESVTGCEICSETADLIAKVEGK